MKIKTSTFSILLVGGIIILAAFSTWMLYIKRDSKLSYNFYSFITHTFKKDSYSPVQPSLDQIFSDNHTWVATLSADRLRTIIATGDVIPARVVNIKTLEYNDFRWPYQKTAEFLRSSDITFINLETPLIKNCPLYNEGFTFCGDSRHVEGLVFAGVDVVSLANNHSPNFGVEGIEETIELLKQNAMKVTGTGDIVVTDIRGVPFVFLGYNDIGHLNGVLHADEDVIKKDIQKAKTIADVVIVQYHWGTEYQSQPDSQQKYLGHFTIDAGADIVIGNHPHWIQPIEIYKNKLITYAHGNFVFDQMWSKKTREGVVAKYVFYDSQLIDVEYFPILIEDFGQPYFLEGEEKRKILESLKYESFILSQKH